MLGEPGLSVTRSTADLNTSGSDKSPIYSNSLLTPHSSFYWATSNIVWDIGGSNKGGNGAPVGFQPLVLVGRSELKSRSLGRNV